MHVNSTDCAMHRKKKLMEENEMKKAETFKNNFPVTGKYLKRKMYRALLKEQWDKLDRFEVVWGG